MIDITNSLRYKFLISIFNLYTGRFPTPLEISEVISRKNLENQLNIIKEKRQEKNNLLPISNYTSLSFVGRLLELTRHNLIKAFEFQNPLTLLSPEGMTAFSEIYKGTNLDQIDFEPLELEEITHLIYYKYLKRIADPGALDRWKKEKSKTELIKKLSLTLKNSKEYSLHGRISDIKNKLNLEEDSRTIYVDVTNTINSGARTGIQRVVRRLASELGSDHFVFIHFNGLNFVEVKVQSGDFALNDQSPPVLFCRGDVFLDIDASWGDRLDRTHLYSSLKKSGIRIINLHYDAVPILLPAYSHPTTVWRYLEHFFAMLTYSDRVICISEAVKNDLVKIAHLVKSRIPPMSVIDMGADIFSEKATSAALPKFLTNKKFVLMVGTIEPRKNYQAILNNGFALKELGISIVIVGKRGWESDNFFKRLEEEELSGNVFWLQNVSDEILLSLYEKCYLYLTTSHYEGYGLPVIEALQHGCCVVSSNGGALQEAGKGVSLVYKHEDDLLNIVRRCVQDQSFYTQAKLATKNVAITSWKESATQLRKIVSEFIEPIKLSSPVFSQLILISTRPDCCKKLLKSFSSFYSIESCVILTKEECLPYFSKIQLDFSFPITIFTDEDVLPKDLIGTYDHTERNFLLRKHLIQKQEIRETFIMADDDYLIHEPPPENYFFNEGKINGGYCAESLQKWLASPFGTTSFDRGRWNEAELLKIFGKSEFVFDSHRPQLISKKDFNEITSEFEHIKGIAEWSIYFNIALDRYPNRYNALRSTTLHWPWSFSSWIPDFFIEDVFFENFYPEQTNSELSFQKRLFNWKTEYLSYKEQQNLNNEKNLFIDLESKSLKGDLSWIGISGIWSRVSCRGVNSVGLAYKIFNENGNLVIDGSRDQQDCHERTGFMIKNPGLPGVYRSVIFDIKNQSTIGEITLSIKKCTLN